MQILHHQANLCLCVPHVPICRCCTLLSRIFRNVFLYFVKSVFHAEISTTNLTLALCCCNRKAVCADFISSSSSSSSSLSSTNEQTRCRLSHLLFVFWGVYCLPVCLFCFFLLHLFFPLSFFNLPSTIYVMLLKV